MANTPTKKSKIVLFFILTCSILGFSMSTIFKIKTHAVEKTNSTISNFVDHPLEGQTDNIVYCSIDALALHEIYLCGTSDTRQLTVDTSDINQVVWSKLQSGSCAEVQEGCSNRSGSCIWDQQSTDTQYTVGDAGEYRIYIEYNNGTNERFYFNVFSNNLNPTTIVQNIDCTNPGSITVNNIPENYEFSFDNGTSWGDSNVFPITAEGSYDLVIRKKDNPTGCLFEINDVLVKNVSINATATASPISCSKNESEISVNVTDTSSNYIYTISRSGSLINTSGAISNTSYTFTNLASGTYDIEVILASSSTCNWTYTETIEPFTTLAPSAVVTKNIDCEPGIITVSEVGGTSPYEYSIDNGVSYFPFNATNQSTISISAAGLYTVRIKDSNGCETNASPVNIATEDEIIYTVDVNEMTCNGIDDAKIIVNVTDTQGYSVTYSKDGGINFQTSRIFPNLIAGTYPIVIKKQKAGSECFIEHGDIKINPKTPFTIDATITTTGDCSSGTASLEASIIEGGTAPITYSINGVDFQNNSTFANLEAGEYTITAKDANDCITTVSERVAANNTPSELTFSIASVDCSTGNSTIEVGVEDGTAPFTFEIVAPTLLTSTDNTFTNLEPDTYKFKVTTVDGCSIERNYTVAAASALEVSTNVKNNVSCFDTSTADGTIAVVVNNYNTSYDIIIKDSSGAVTGLGITGVTSNNTSISGFKADVYTISVTDGTGACPAENTIEIKAPTASLEVAAPIVTNIYCGSPGDVTISATGGWGMYNYALQKPDTSITPFQTTNTINGLDQPGIYTIIVKDINGCENKTQTFDLEEKNGPDAAVDQSNSNYCYSSASLGELKIDITSGEAPYYYVLNNGTPQTITGTSFTLNSLTPNDYEVKVIDSKGCETIVTDTKITGQLFAFAKISKPLGCGSSPDAIIEVTVEEGYPNPEYTYEVSLDGASYVTTTVPYSASIEGTYEFKVIDGKGCETITKSVVIDSGDPITATSTPAPTACGIDGTGSVMLTASGGIPPLQYSFNGAAYSTKTLYTDLNQGFYTYSVKDAVGCTIDDMVEIGATLQVTADVSHTDIECDPNKTDGATLWGNTKIENIQNATGNVTIRLNRVINEADYLATGWFRTYRTYENRNPNANLNIRMTWAQWFFVEIEDEAGCIYTSDFFEITQPPFPIIDKSVVADQTCANGATFDFEVGDPIGLIGPFRVRLWPFDIDATDNGDYLAFDDASNELYDPTTTDPANDIYERDFRFTGLLFGVEYNIIVLDENTGCKRFLRLGQVNEPADNNGFDVISEVKAKSCRTINDGEVTVTVKGAGDGDFDGLQTVSWQIYQASNPGNTALQRSGTIDDGGIGGDFELVISDLPSTWYVLEVTSESGCATGNRFPIHNPSALNLTVTQNVNATCNYAAQLNVQASGGWGNETIFNRRNSPRYRSGWHPYEYLYVVNGTDPYAQPDSEWSTSGEKIIVPAAYDGQQNVYQVYVRDGGGCYKALNSPITISKDETPEITGINVTNRCTSTDEIYEVVASINDGKGTNIYIWDGNPTSLKTQQLGPGNHTLEVRDENGCTATENIFIYPQMVSKAVISVVEQCDPINNGEVILEVYGGSTNYTFERVDTGETNTTGIFTGLSHSISYNFIVTDNESGCAPQTVSATLDAPAAPDFVARVVRNVTCNGASDGAIIVEQASGSVNTDVVYEYSLDGITYQSSNLFENLPVGNDYSIRVKSSKNCIQTLPDEEITQPAVLALDTPTVSTFECASDNTLGSATITALVMPDTGTAPYLLSFNGFSFSSETTFSIPFTDNIQTVTIDAIDANNCTASITVDVPAATKLQATVTEIQSMTCEDDAIIDITITDGIGTYTVLEKPNASAPVSIVGTTVTIAPGNPGTYVFEVYDTTTKCSTTISYTALPFDALTIANITKISDITCDGFTDGAFSFEVSGFASDFTYEVFDVANTSTSYSQLQSSTSTGPILIDTLPGGAYYVVVTDNTTGCFRNSERITIQSPIFALELSLEISREIRCDPANDAEVIATATGGWGGYQFQLTNTATGTIVQAYDSIAIFEGLEAGATYEVSVLDEKGCSNVTETISIPLLTNIVIDTPIVVQPSCYGTEDGSISVSATGGEGAAYYQYILNNLTTGVSRIAQTAATFSNLKEGEYTITVSDNLGCSDTTSPTITLTNPSEVTIDGFISEDPTCLLEGKITVTAAGGSGAFEYKIISPTASATSWSTQTEYTLASGTYEFIARDIPNECTSPVSVIRTLQEVIPLSITVDDSSTIINCFGETDAVLVAEAAGGFGNYTYQLETNGVLQGSPQNNGIFENLGKGNYRILATSGVDCKVTSTEITIEEPSLLTANITTQQDILCFDEETGEVTITAVGGVSPYTYTISSEPLKASDSNTFSNLPAGSYSVFVQDTNGCEIEVPVFIDGPSAPLDAAILRVENEICSSDDNGLIEVSITGGTAPYQYNLESADGTFTTVLDPTSLILDNLDGGIAYPIYIKDANGCTKLLLQEISLGTDLSASIKTEYICEDRQPKSVTTVTLDDPELMDEVLYALDSDQVSDAQASPIFENISTGTHFINIIHEGGCIKVFNNIDIKTLQPLTLTDISTNLNELAVEATGGDGDYTYAFNGVPQSSNIFMISSSGLYTVTVTDGKGCEEAIQIEAEFIDVEIPNFFTPDGDGNNDIWRIKHSETYPNMFVYIFDRYGRKLKEFVGQGEWDGSYAGEDLPAGGYWCVIKLNGEEDTREFIKPLTIYR